MTEEAENVTAWPIGVPWPTNFLTPPFTALEISFIEIEFMIAGNDHAQGVMSIQDEPELARYYAARASYLRQRLAEIAPDRLHAERRGNA